MTVDSPELESRLDGDSGDLDAENRLRIVIQWIDDFVARPHADLGRVGDVCPYMERAMRRDYADFRAFDGRDGDNALLALVREVRETLLERADKLEGDPAYLTTVIISHGLPDAELADMLGRVHEVLKPEFVERGLMLGEFWPNHVGPGLHNDQFRPLASPLPLLAVRHMVLTDLYFLTLPNVVPEQQLEFLEHYSRIFDGQMSERWRTKLLTAEADARAALSDRALA